MKVLLVFREEEAENLFVSTLYEGIKEGGINIECSLQKFWHSESDYDIIHFQWPEEIVGWSCSDPKILDKLKERIAHYKQRNSKFIYTRHNSRPHYTNNIIAEAYAIIETAADLVVHMGKYSLREFEKEYPDSNNTIIPHHIYEYSYNTGISQSIARIRLGIPENKFVITAFGKFRNKEEVLMTLRMFFHVKIKNKLLLVPRLFPFERKPITKNLIKYTISWIGYHLGIPFFRLLNIYGGSNTELVSNEDLPYYMSACDLVFIQRKHILNSGNIPLAFLFHKIVIGPNIGNVGELLTQTGNPTFESNDTSSIARAIERANTLSKDNHGEANYAYAKSNMGIEYICGLYIKAYRSLL